MLQGRLWNISTTIGNPSGMHLVEVDRKRAQSSSPHRMSQSESAPSGNNITLVGDPLGMNLSDGLLLGNPTSTKQSKIGRGRYNCNGSELLPIIASHRYLQWG